MKSITYLPGLSYTHSFYVNEIKNDFKYNIHSTSPSNKFIINKNGKFKFTPMPFKIFTRLFNINYPNYLKRFDMKFYNITTKLFIRKTDIYHANALYAIGAFKSKKTNNSLKILEEQNSNIIICNKLLTEEYLKFGLKYKYDEKLYKQRIEEYNLSDKILVPSNYAYDSFLKMGFNKNKLIKNMIINNKYLSFKKKKNR